MRHSGTWSFSRRSFLRGCGLSLAGFGLTSLFPGPFVRQALAAPTSSNRRLLFLFLRGGNDGINTLIPHGDTAYSAVHRPTLYVPPTEAIDLNGFASFHPALQPMLEAFQAGELAVIHRVGYEDSSQSHFDGQRIWENGDPTRPALFEGWLYRYIHDNALAAGVTLPAFSVQPLSPTLLRGEQKFVNIADPGGFDYLPGEPLRSKYATGWRQLHSDLVGLEPYRPVLSQTGVSLTDTLDEYRSWDQANWDPKDPVTGASLFPVSPATDQAGFGQESYGFFGALKVSALALLESDPGSNDNGTRVAGTQLGSFDHHNNQGQLDGQHAKLLSWLAYGFRSLRIVFSGAALDPRNYPSIWDDTAVVTLSEFGRTTMQNGSGGTDHAAASCLFLQGGGVNGGVYNCDGSTWPEGVMFGVDGRYLQLRTDYRAIFWELLRDHMGADPGTLEAVFPDYTALGLGSQELGLFVP